jgi:hypothetical protein
MIIYCFFKNYIFQFGSVTGVVIVLVENVAITVVTPFLNL